MSVSLKEARCLQEKTRKALGAMGDYKTCFTEDEVRFRHRALWGMLRMAVNDINQMVSMWERESNDSI